MLRTIAKSLAQAVAIALVAELCWSLLAFCVERHSFDLGPLLILLVYPLPIAVAAARKHNAQLDIIITNFWLGWTVIGWFVVLIWACDTDVELVAE